MSRKPRIAVIVGSTRATRFADKPAAWLMSELEGDTRFQAELVDLRDFDLPLFDEPASDLWMPSRDPAALAWQKKIAEFDGFIFLVAEYNHSITGALKNALDQAYTQWVHKPFGAVGYGGVGGARAVEHLRGIGVELKMVSTRSAVHLAAGEFIKVHPMGGNAEMAEVAEALRPALTAMLDELEFWLSATIPARAEAEAKAA